MAHFAALNDSNEVVNVIVVDNVHLTGDSAIDQEKNGILYLRKCGFEGHYVQTSYNNNMRNRYAGIGMTYSAEHDAFIALQPYPSWTLDLDDPNDWVAPVPMPTDEVYWYEWDEGNLVWIAHEIIE